MSGGRVDDADGMQAVGLVLLGRGIALALEGHAVHHDGVAQLLGVTKRLLHRGDVVTIDPYGYMHITDRAKDVIKSGGEWISSIELENLAVAHPDVAEAAVVAARHPKWDERPLLLLVPKPGRKAPAQGAMLEFLAGKVAKWWLPDAVIAVEELPHTATGKLNKLALRERWGGYLEAAAKAAE